MPVHVGNCVVSKKMRHTKKMCSLYSVFALYLRDVCCEIIKNAVQAHVVTSIDNDCHERIKENERTAHGSQMPPNESMCERVVVAFQRL